MPPLRLQINNRKLMRGFFESPGVADGERQALMLRGVDKLDKRGPDYVREKLAGECWPRTDGPTLDAIDCSSPTRTTIASS